MVTPNIYYVPALAHKTSAASRLPYPPNTKAFLYYFTPPEKPRIAGELRLRVASSDDPASFESGSDLLLPNGQLWSRPLFVLPKYYFPLYAKLRDELLVPDDLDTALSTMPSEYPIYHRKQLLYTLNDTFILSFGGFGQILLVITEQGTQRIVFHRRFVDSRQMYRCAPYTGAYTNHLLSRSYINCSHEFVGSALARFERSTLPDHKGTRTIVLRFLKIIIPVKCVIPNYDGHICCPREGELHRRTKHSTSDSEWSANIDKVKSNSAVIRGFQLLWDA